MSHRLTLTVLAAACTVALSACGGGGGGSTASNTASNNTPATPAAPTLASSVSGVAATGKPVAGATITAYGSDGRACGSAQTNASGSYTMTTQCAAGPVTFAVTSGPAGLPPLGAIGLPNSSGAVSGTVNLTPLSTLALYEFVATQTIVPTAQAEPDFAHVLATVPTIWAAGPLMGKSTAQIVAQIQAAARAVVQSVAAQLQAAGVNPTGFDPVTTPFAANGQGLDAFFDQNPASAPAANAYQLGSLLRLQLPAQPGTAPAFGGSAGAALSASGGALAAGATVPASSASSPGTAASGTASSGSYTISVSGFTGALAGSSCSLSASGGQVSGNCTLAGTNYPTTGTLAANAYGFAILNAHPGNLSAVDIVGTLQGSSGSTQGAWVDVLGSIVPGGGSGNVVVQYSAN